MSTEKLDLIKRGIKKYTRLDDLAKAYLNGWIDGKLDNEPKTTKKPTEEKKAG